jgi:septin family protein
MVCGASGLGKSNFIEFMLKQVNFEAATELFKNEPKNDSDHSLNRLTQQIKGYTLKKPFDTSKTELNFTIYDSPGYGSSTHSDF